MSRCHTDIPNCSVIGTTTNQALRHSCLDQEVTKVLRGIVGAKRRTCVRADQFKFPKRLHSRESGALNIASGGRSPNAQKKTSTRTHMHIRTCI